MDLSIHLELLVYELSPVYGVPGLTGRCNNTHVYTYISMPIIIFLRLATIITGLTDGRRNLCAIIFNTFFSHGLLDVVILTIVKTKVSHHPVWRVFFFFMATVMLLLSSITLKTLKSTGRGASETYVPGACLNPGSLFLRS